MLHPNPGKCVLVPLKFFIDESYRDGGVFVLGGLIIDESAVEVFSGEWEALLPPFGCDRRKDGVRHFKMAQMAYEGRMENVPQFCAVIEKHAIALVSLKFDLADLEAARARFMIPLNREIDWAFYATPYRVGYVALMDMFNARENWQVAQLPADAIVAPIFDDNFEKNPILKGWEQWAAEKPEHRRRFYVKPEFEDDTKLLPLQGADLWAWWVRRWYEDGTPKKIGGFDIGIWKQSRTDLPKINFTYSEDQLFGSLAKTVRTTLKEKIGPLGAVWPIIDRRSRLPVCV